jgi:hypothetical protein
MTDPTVNPHHDTLKQLEAYWRAKKGDRRAPARADLDPIEIPALMPHLLLLDVEPASRRLRFRLMGTAVTNGLGRDLTGRYLDELPLNKTQRAMYAEYKRVVESGEPACSTWEYSRADGRHVRFERLVLPLSSDGETIDMLLGGIVFDTAHG